MEEIGVADGGRREGKMLWVVVGLAGRAVRVPCVHIDVSVVLGGCGWSGRCRVVLWVGAGRSRGITGACGVGVLWWAHFRGALVVYWRTVDGDGGCVWGVE